MEELRETKALTGSQVHRNENHHQTAANGYEKHSKMNGQVSKGLVDKSSNKSKASEEHKTNGYHLEIPCSIKSQKCINPIRMIMESLVVQPNPTKHLIQISQGDPAINNLFPLPEEMKMAVREAVDCCKYNCYFPSAGLEITRKAVAEYYFSLGIEMDWKDVFITTGCTQALLWSIEALANPGDNILLPRPCFSIYKTFTGMAEIEAQYYDLIPEKNWTVDLVHFESLINSRTKAILINNPSNPCGSVYSKEHLRDIVNIAELHNIPIISDEVYTSFIFPGHEFHSLATISKSVPVLICNSLSKMFIIPGWRIGWVAVYDPNNVISEVKSGINRFTQANFGASSLIQAALVGILKNTPKSYVENAVNLAYNNALSFYNGLKRCPGITPIMPQGSMFMMVKIDLDTFPNFTSETQFIERLITEQSVFPFPSSIFGIPGYLRISLILTNENARIAVSRMAEFLNSYYKPSSINKNA